MKALTLFMLKSILIWATALPLGAGLFLGLLALWATTGRPVEHPQMLHAICGLTGGLIGGSWIGYLWGKYFGLRGKKKLRKI